MTCPACGAGVPADALACPSCRRLTNTEQLEDLSRRAKEAWRLGRFTEERAHWLQALALLPDDTVQHRSLTARVAEIDELLAGSVQPSRSGWGKAGMGLGPALLLALSKGKFLLLGLTKIGTLLTMAASLGVYWAMYGWALAIGVVISIYIHEMGHVAKIRAYGLPASAPMFIPGLGAFIRLRGRNLPPIPDARIGLAGPIYGLGAALAAAALYYLTGNQIWAVIAHFGAVINMFNLIPVWQLDGSRGLRSLSRYQRGIVLFAAGVLWLVTSAPMLVLVALACAWRLFTRDWQEQPDRNGLLQFVGLLVALSVLTAVTAGYAMVSK
jgi:Zn-dependent protease